MWETCPWPENTLYTSIHNFSSGEEFEQHWGYWTFSKAVTLPAAHLEVQTSLVWKELAEVRKDGHLTCLYLSTLTPSSWLRRTRFVPTRILSSCLSRSLFSLSRLWPWCCIRTQSLFISAKFSSTKSIESLMSPVVSSLQLIRLRTQKLVRGIHPSSHWWTHKF